MHSANHSNHFFVMTVDVDGWSSLLNFYSVKHDPLKANSEVNIKKGISTLVQLFGRNKINATFFVTGDMAERHSLILKKVHEYGNEIACHGLTHVKNECLLDSKVQKERIKKATEIIDEEIHVTPKGFRAPCLRISNNTLDALEENGYLYDSSVIPTLIPGYYGSLGALMQPYHPSSHSIRRKGSRKILEIPVSVNPIIPLPLSAAWMRNLGTSWVKFGILTNFFLHHPVVFYVHPRDVLPLPKVKGVPWHLYRNVGNSAVKMLNEIIEYAKNQGARFVKAIDLVSTNTTTLDSS